jgi:hypothetical protein
MELCTPRYAPSRLVSQFKIIAERLLPQAVSPATLRLIQLRIDQNFALLR